MNARSLWNLRAALALIVGASLASTVFAQTGSESNENENKDTLKLDKFEVTGSRIPRTEIEGASPIKVITRADIAATGRSNAAELLRDIPEASAIGINESGTTAAVRGSNALDLRNLGANNTLVIVDGRRVVLTGNNSGGTTFVDLNRFPVSMIERIEVLKDGASAIYGADATAGVVNIITRKDYNGTEIGTTYGNTFDTDVAELSANVFAGASSGKARGSVALSYFKRNALHARDRDFSKNADKTADAIARGYEADATAGYWDLRSGTGNVARLSIRAGQVQGGIPTVGVAPNGYAYPAGTAIDITGLAAGAAISRLPGTGGATAGTLASASPAFTGVTNSPAGGVYNAAMANLFVAQRLSAGQTPSNLYNFQEFVWLVPKQERVGMRTQFAYDFTPEIEGYLTASYQQNKSEIQLAPSPISTSGDNQIYVPRYNYWNPFGVDVNFNYRPTEVGPRISNVTNNNWEILTGIKGKFLDRFHWDTAAYFGYDEVFDVTRNALSESRVRAALAKTDSTALNIFGGADFKNNKATIDSLKVTDQKGGSAELRLYDFKVDGTLFEIPGMGEVGGAIYTEFREERFNEANSAISTTLDDIIGQVRLADSTSAQRSVTSLAAEASVPLVKAKTIPFIESAELSVAARFEDFSDGYDSGWKPYVGVKYRPVKDLVLRASFTQAFRAPTLPQLFGGVRESLPSGLPDLARPQALTGDPFDGSATQRLVRAGGNKDLKPEEAESTQFGFVYEVPAKISFLKGLSFEVTRFQIEQENIITTTGTSYLRQNEFGDAAGLIVRDPGTETYTNNTANSITVYTGPGAYSTATGSTTVKVVAPGQSITVPGRIRYLSDTYVNLAYQRVTGWDFGIRYDKKTTSLGRFVARTSATYMEEYTFTRTPGGELPNYVDRDGYPRYRIQTTFGWSYKDWQANLGNNYTAAYGDPSIDGYRINAWSVWNANASYQIPAGVKWLEGVIVTVGLDNVLDEQPDLYYDGVGYDSSIVGRPQGRFGYLSLRKEF